MAGLPWIKVAVEVGGHPKLEHFERLLGLEDGLGVIIRMWAWVASYCPAGFIPDTRTAPMERHVMRDLTVRYGGVPGMFSSGGPADEGDCLKALVESGWLERVTPPVTPGPGYLVHDWEDMQSAHSERAKEKNRERQRRYRERHSGHNVTGNVTVTAPEESRGEEKKKIPAALRAPVLVLTHSAPPVDAPKAKRAAATDEKPPDPRHRPMQDALEAAYHEVRGHGYGFQGRDPRALTKILALSKGDQAEAVRRFKIGLREQFKARCDSIFDLADKWNSLTAPNLAANGGPPEPKPTELR